MTKSGSLNNSAAKTDGEMMNNCCNGYGGGNLNTWSILHVQGGQDTSCYNPSNINSKPCPLDRTGKPIFACFPAVGDQISNCRSSCVNGHPQDPNFKLNDTDVPVAIANSDTITAEIPIAERGVELYENYGLDTSVRSDSGPYGWDKTKMSCIADLGRKVSLFGDITFTVNANVYEDKHTGAPAFDWGNKKSINIATGDVNYNFKINTSNDRYGYFGNHGVVFHYNGVSYPYIVGKIESWPDVGINVGSDGLVEYRISNYLFMKKTFNVSAEGYYVSGGSTSLTGQYIYGDNEVVDARVVRPGSSTGNASGWKYTDVAPLFPVPWTRQYFFNLDNLNDSGWNTVDGSGSTYSSIYPYNCYGNGVKSVYVPPHMEVKSYSYYNPVYSNNKLVNSTASPGTKVTKTIRTENSLYHNGVFPAIGVNTIPEAIQGAGAVTTNRNSVFNIPAGSMYQVTVGVRQDDGFYNKYVKPFNTQFAPEIFLIPGISKASGFAGTLSAYNIKSRLGDPLQKMRNAQDYWSSANPAWNPSFGVVQLNENYNPGDVLYGPTDNPPMSGEPHSLKFTFNDGNVSCGKSGFTSTSDTSNTIVSATGLVGSLTDRIKNVIATDNAYADWFASHISDIALRSARVIGFDVESPIPTGKYRIQRFDVINGVFSIEWLYVLFYCAMNGRKLVQWDPDAGKYVTTGCTPTSNNTCGMECLLFRDDYTYANYQNSPLSPADVAMRSYCGMRNLSGYYGTWQQQTSIFSNECSCMTQKQFCPVQFNPGCSKASDNTTRYVSADMYSCADASICGYCSVTVNQVITSIAGCTENSDNTLKNYGQICGNTNCTYNIDDPSSGPSGDDDDETISNTKKPIGVLVLLLIIIIAVLFVGVFAIKKYFVKNK